MHSLRRNRQVAGPEFEDNLIYRARVPGEPATK